MTIHRGVIPSRPLLFSQTVSDKKEEPKGEQEFYRLLVTPETEVLSARTGPHWDQVADEIEKVGRESKNAWRIL
jgi:hypothetical protein